MNNLREKSIILTDQSPSVLHGTIDGVEIRLTDENRIFCRIVKGPLKDKVMFPRLRGRMVFFDRFDFKPTPALEEYVRNLLQKQFWLRETHHKEPVFIPTWNTVL